MADDHANKAGQVVCGEGVLLASRNGAAPAQVGAQSGQQQFAVALQVLQQLGRVDIGVTVERGGIEFHLADIQLSFFNSRLSSTAVK